MVQKATTDMTSANKKKYYFGNVREWSEKEMNVFWKDFKGRKKILDVGCGAGIFGRYKPRGVEVYGCDFDKGSIKHAQKWEKAVLHDIRKELPYKDNTFDGALVKDVFEHVLEPWNLLLETKRVLKKGGILLATVPAPTKKAWDDYTHVRPFTKRSIRELFLDHGMKIIYIKPIRGIFGFGRLGLNELGTAILRVPGLSLLTQGYKIKATKP
ncbi:MAG: class I SAM-dependent methyltransferase [Nanoarchaeota archaeon]|nr:class I SAM-dependent methyltransferase [Nanoarchaeota archaeon]